jgi:hypothetical protein
VKAELTEKFGGVTMHLDAPAEGLWQDDGAIEEDRIVTAEVMTEVVDRVWWARYRAELETRFRQDEIVIPGRPAARLLANRTKGVQILQSQPDPDTCVIADRRRDSISDYASTVAAADQSSLHPGMVTMATNPSGLRNDLAL